jgi:hypothetical protein
MYDKRYLRPSTHSTHAMLLNSQDQGDENTLSQVKPLPLPAYPKGN